MLDSTTKRRIDTARDILVGKVPDPKSQVEQITIALIYKFMDDMDAQGEELGGARKFFANDFARYGWAKLMRSGLGGHETLNLYAEAISKMPENPGIPPLFREIFKNAFLPYRDPETLKSFLKIIDEFDYDHSEKLGDAFEYLLSVLGSQGDAGQFRTPRHIIDFMVEIVAPKKNETVLDPACGTAGFLISAYKHILKTNTDANGQVTLTPDDRGKMATNFKGYDISPDMVRLSLVNLYLHGFTDPHVYEYDTLTSEDRWNETADVILANPPFMSPKGGIKPHQKFSIQAKRSEVLFVDYIAEHLSANGRAAIIVPEGIIFQGQSAYVQLRKTLVESYLVAVISLPAGIFNPYSGVKTSILIMDKALAKRATTVGFFKIENDGFSLGAQRREGGKNDLPQVKTEIETYVSALQLEQSGEDLSFRFGIVVSKDKIIANGEYNLTGDRYRDGTAQASRYRLRTIETLVETVTPPQKIQKTAYLPKGRFPIIDQSQDAIAGWTDDETALVHPEKPYVIFGDHTCALKIIEVPFAQGADGIKILKTVEELDPLYLYNALRAHPLESEGYQRHFSKLKEHSIPLPPLDVQKEIVSEIEGYQKIINGAFAIIDNYRPHIVIDPNWPTELLGSHFKTTSGGTPSKAEPTYWDGTIPWVSPKDMKSLAINDTEDHITEAAIENSSTKLLPAGTVVCVVRSGILQHTYPVAVLSRPMCINQDLVAFLPTSNAVRSKFLFFVLKTLEQKILEEGIKPGVTVQSFRSGFFHDLRIPVPDTTIQDSVVLEMEEEMRLVASSEELASRFQEKIRAALARVWSEAEPQGKSEA